MQKTAALSSAQGDKVRRWNVSRHKAEIQTPPHGICSLAVVKKQDRTVLAEAGS